VGAEHEKKVLGETAAPGAPRATAHTSRSQAPLRGSRTGAGERPKTWAREMY
jgi:hypothetical protein